MGCERKELDSEDGEVVERRDKYTAPTRKIGMHAKQRLGVRSQQVIRMFCMDVGVYRRHCNIVKWLFFPEGL